MAEELRHGRRAVTGTREMPGRDAAGADPDRPPDRGSDPVVLVPDPAPVRWYHRWRRAGAAEGRRSESHPLRATGLALAVGALVVWLPGAAAFLGILSVVIVVHEGGHHLVARRAGMRPTEFFLGFGPTVVARTTRGGLRWGLKLVPAGGYVKIPGMGPSEEVERSREPYTYRAATRPRRLAVILAGVIANLLLALVMFWGYAMTSPTSDLGAWDAAGSSLGLGVEVVDTTAASLGRLVTGADDYVTSVAGGDPPEDRMVSAVGGAQITADLLDQHPSKLLLLGGLFSASVAVFNLVPLLPLDGGHAALVLWEGAWARLRRRPDYRLDPERFRIVAVVVVAVLLALGASSIYLDLTHPVSVAAG